MDSWEDGDDEIRDTNRFMGRGSVRFGYPLTGWKRERIGDRINRRARNNAWRGKKNGKG
jgi:hypothetical protein